MSATIRDYRPHPWMIMLHVGNLISGLVHVTGDDARWFHHMMLWPAVGFFVLWAIPVALRRLPDSRDHKPETF